MSDTSWGKREGVKWTHQTVGIHKLGMEETRCTMVIEMKASKIRTIECSSWRGAVDSRLA